MGLLPAIAIALTAVHKTSHMILSHLPAFRMRRLLLPALFFSIGFTGHTQQATPAKHLPIIDVHVHAMKVNPAFAADMCPWFLSSMPGGDPNQPPPVFINTDCADPLKAAKSDKEFQDALMATMKRLNMTIVVSDVRPKLSSS